MLLYRICLVSAFVSLFQGRFDICVKIPKFAQIFGGYQMTDILFINATNTNKLSYQANGTMLLATKLLAAGFKTEILRFYEIESLSTGDYYKFLDDIISAIMLKDPKCVSFYTLWPYYHIFLRISQKLKEINPDIIIVMGGPQSSATAQATMDAMPFVDYIATGEGENTIVPFCDCILRKNRDGIENIPGLYYRDNDGVKFNHTEIELSDLNTLPHWDDRLYKVTETDLDKDSYYMPIDAGRGCPYSCTFCCTSLFWKRTYRLKSAERIVEDIKFFNKKYGIKSFGFSHDALTANRNLISDICDYIIDNNLDITWRCTSRIDCVDKELLLKMKKSGLAEIEFGVETGSLRMQKLTKKNLNFKNAKEIVKFLVENNVGVTLFFMYGFPEETEEDLNQTLELFFDYTDMGIKYANMSFCRFNPTTDITERYLNDLVFDPEIKILSRDILGHTEEVEMIKNNKNIFPHFYHLNTHVRNTYQYLTYFTYLYSKFPNSLKYIRHYYNSDNLKFYQDFYNNNIDVFNNDMAIIKKMVTGNPVQILKNTFKNFEKPLFDRICALVEYDFDLQTVVKSKEDMSIQKKYAFNYIEHQLKLPLEQYSDTSTELLIEKKNGKLNIRVISI